VARGFEVTRADSRIIDHPVARAKLSNIKSLQPRCAPDARLGLRTGVNCSLKSTQETLGTLAEHVASAERRYQPHGSCKRAHGRFGVLGVGKLRPCVS
jgi:hypothetical protein